VIAALRAAYRAQRGSAEPGAVQIAVSAAPGLLRASEVGSWSIQAATVLRLLDEAVPAIAAKGRVAAEHQLRAILPPPRPEPPAAAPSDAAEGNEGTASGSGALEEQTSAGQTSSSSGPGPGPGPSTGPVTVSPLPVASPAVAEALLASWMQAGEGVVNGMVPEPGSNTAAHRANQLAAATGYFLENDCKPTPEMLAGGSMPNSKTCHMKRILVDASPAAAMGRLRKFQAAADAEVKAAGDAALLTDPSRCLAIPSVSPLPPVPSGLQESSLSWVDPSNQDQMAASGTAMAVGCEGSLGREAIVSLDTTPLKMKLYAGLGLQVPPSAFASPRAVAVSL